MPILRSHHDSDGITAGYFLSLTIPNSTIQVWDGQFGDTTGLKEGDYMVDMRPLQDLEGLSVIDHHPPYPANHKYKLITGMEPASYLTWKHCKDVIPKDQWWKLAIGVLGDGQPELIPYEVFEQCPQLLMKVKTSSYMNKYNYKWETSYYPIYKLLSSRINALLRIKAYEPAVNLMKKSVTPMEILMNKEAKVAKAKVKAEYERIMVNCESYNFEDLIVYLFESDYRMAGYISQTQSDNAGKTVLAINKKDGNGSLRGDLAEYWKHFFKGFDYFTVDGHPGFMGAHLSERPEIFIQDLSKKLTKRT